MLVRVKANQPKLLGRLVTLCAETAPFDRHETVDRPRHGRQEHRSVAVFDTAGRLGPTWQPWIASVGRITRLTWVKDTRTGFWQARDDVAYYAGQSRRAAISFARAVRTHWGIENRDHHVRDRILGEDDRRTRRKPGMVARLRSFALNILQANGVSNVRQALYANALSLDRLLASPVG